MNSIIENNQKEALSGLWIILMINMIFNDIFTIMVELDKWQRPEFIADAKMLMLIAAFVTNIPIVMIFLSRFLRYTINRRLNIGVGSLLLSMSGRDDELSPLYCRCGH